MPRKEELPKNKLTEFAKSLGFIALGLVLIFVVINWSYFVENFNYWWRTDVEDDITQPEVEPVDFRKPNIVYIPAIDLEAPLIYTDAKTEAEYQKALENGVVHYPGTAKPGEDGNAYFFGHSSDFPTKPGHYKTVFALLPRIHLGDQVVVTDEAGRAYTYEVIDRQVIKPTDTQWLSQGDRSEKLLTLQTSYPVGTAISRFIVRARLVK